MSGKDNIRLKDKILIIASSYNIPNGETFYKNFKLEKRNKQYIYETSKSNLDEYKNCNQYESFYGMQLCIQSKKKTTNQIEFKMDKQFISLMKKLDIQQNDRDILYILLIQYVNDFKLDFSSQDPTNNYIIHVPDFGLVCSICGGSIKFITRQVRSADEGDKTYAVCSNDETHVFSTDRFTIGSETQNEEVGNILFDR